MHWRYERERGHTEEPTATTAARVAGSSPSSTPGRETYDGTCGAKLNHAQPRCGMGTRLHFAGDSHGRHRLTHHGGGAWRALPALAGAHLHRLVRDRPLFGGGAQ